MNITIGTVGTFLIILFAINVSLVGLGLTDTSFATTTNVLNTIPTNIEATYQTNDLNVTSGQAIQGGTDSTTDQSNISGIPYKTGVFSRSEKFISLIKGLTIGYATIFIAMGLPALIVWLLTGIIGFFEFLAIFYVLAYIFSILRGGGGI